MSNSSLSPVEVHGHRGCRGLLPENTLPAFQHAVALGVDALEMDVVISADGQVVVSHEPWLSSLCWDEQGVAVLPGTEQQHNLYRRSYAQISRCDCGLTPHPGFPRQQQMPAYKPLLRDVIRAVEGYARQLGRPPLHYSIELKSWPAGDDIFHPQPAEFVRLVLSVLGEELHFSRATILSFDKRILRQVREQAPSSVPICLLIEDENPWPEHLAGFGFLPDVYGPLHSLVTADLVDGLRRAGVRLVPWTVNEAADMSRLLRLGVQGITTDYPDLLLELLHRA